MKREVKDLEFFLCPTTEIDVGRQGGRGGINQTEIPLSPKGSSAIEENAEPISHGEKVKKALKIAAIIAVVALFVGFAVAFVVNNPELFKIEPSGKPIWKW
ncbi:MAG: hypothetical protein IKJ94_06240 [Oscillospiraceae bacterium]|nr:hypothetical protein [Oscillospiraceae bacterium]